MDKEIKVRIAPSPTGLFHIGTARTALFNYLFAKKNKGKFILRIEDTDIERSKKEYQDDIIGNLKWLGLEWDGDFFKQSERIETYKKHIKKLLESGEAFWCDHTQEELEKERKEQIKRKEAPRHVCERRSKAKKGIIRFHCPEKTIVFNDLIRGELKFDTSLFGDISVAKDENTPLYNLAVVIDDADMEISHVIRGEDHISNTPKQILLMEALGFKTPQFAHLPLILGSDKSKLSKRHGAVSVNQYRKEGYLPEAINNFMALLGWNPGTEKEIFSLDELIKEFSLEKVHKGGAVFNLERLDWINSQHIRKMDLDKLTKKCQPYFKENNDFDYLKKIVSLEKKRIKKLSEIKELTQFFFTDKLDYDKNLLIWNPPKQVGEVKEMSLDDVKNNLVLLKEKLEKIEEFNQKSLESIIMPIAEEKGRGELLWPLRTALSGQRNSPSPFEIMDVLGKKRTLKRIKEAIKKADES